MPFADTPELLRQELNSLRITHDVIEEDTFLALPLRIRDEMEELGRGAKAGKSRTIRRLQQLTRDYPDYPPFKNLLAVAFTVAGRTKEADALHKQTHREHPDYLFGKLNMAANLLDSPEESVDVPLYLGESLRLSDAQPRDIHHISEVRNFYLIVARYHLLNERLELARTIVDFLQKHVPEDPGLRHLTMELGFSNLKSLQARMQEDEKRAIRVSVPAAIRPATVPPRPALHHPELEELYDHDIDLPDQTITEILALPRETLVADLKRMLQYAIARGPAEEDLSGTTTFFPGHVIMLLGELKATESSSTVLQFLSQHPDVLESWFGDDLPGSVEEPLCHMLEADLEKAFRWMTSPGIPEISRGALSGAVSMICSLQPHRRDEVIEWFQRVMEFLRDSPPSDNVLDTMLLSYMVSDAIDIRAAELLPVIESLYSRGYVAESLVGSFQDVAREMAKPPASRDRNPWSSLNSPFGEFDVDPEDPQEFWSPEQPLPNFSFLEDDHESTPLKITTPNFPVGRNDPCPCGSGRKYKKCCLQ